MFLDGFTKFSNQEFKRDNIKIGTQYQILVNEIKSFHISFTKRSQYTTRKLNVFFEINNIKNKLRFKVSA